jgi:putative aldouronate transport system permease protein
VKIKQGDIKEETHFGGSRGLKSGLKELWTNKLLYAMMLPGIARLILFHYVPLYGILIAFKKYSFKDGIWGSPWVGLENFRFLFNYYGTARIFRNTIVLNILFIASSTVCSVFLALVFVEIKNRMFKKIVQTIAVFPHFVTWTVVAMFLGGIIGANGIISNFIIGLTGKDPDFYNTATWWPLIFVLLRVWQGAGYGTIVYVAAITGFDQEMYEAAWIDGANRWQQVTRITLPMFKTTILMLTILAIGGIFRGDFGMIYALLGDNPELFATTDVIDTFVYRALRQLNNLGMSTATGLFQAVVGFILVRFTNWITKRLEPEAALF